jgi:hypothetical protein
LEALSKEAKKNSKNVEQESVISKINSDNTGADLRYT